MTKETAQPISPDPPAYPDRDNPLFALETIEWQKEPTISDMNDVTSTSPNPRRQFLENYRQITTTMEWNRYHNLGYYAYEDGQTFNKVWINETTTWLFRHQIIWYNYRYHIDHSMDTSVLLHNWATQLSHPYLLCHHADFISVDTRNQSWRNIQRLMLEPDNEVVWNTVGQKKKSSLKKHVTYSNSTPVTDGKRIRPPIQSGASKTVEQQTATSSLTILSPLTDKPGVLYPPPKTNPGKNKILLKSTMGILHRNADTKLNSMAQKSAAAIRAAWNLTHPNQPDLHEIPIPLHGESKTEKPVEETNIHQPDTTMQEPPLSVPDSIPEVHTPMDAQSAMTDDSDAKQSAFRPSLNVATNDGTMRITVRWTPNDKTLSHTRDLSKWTEAALTMLQDLFPDDHGSAYRWESQDLATWKNLSTMHPIELRDFISPTVTYVSSTRMFIFGFRYGFTTRTPVSWKSHELTRDAMRKHQVWTTESNSCCTSGKLVHAGFILMKAPNTTHTIRYLQSLRNRLPENTPFFDVQLRKKSPTEQQIHHLVVECGENHVAPLTKAISALLTGTGGAIFLPRVVLGSLTNAQISKYFTAHANYVKSLRPICLAPRITNLDTIREEYFENGEVLRRSTREWATTLSLQNDEPARCDIVNGGKDQVANLLVPSHIFSEVIELYAAYKMRLNPLERREARFRDELPGLPAEIQIDTSVRASLACLEFMSSEAIWQRAPPAVKPQAKQRQNAAPRSQDRPPEFPNLPIPAAASIPIPTDGASSMGSDSDGSRNPQSGSKSSRRRRGHPGKSKQAKAQAPNVTDTSTLTNSQEYQEMTKLIQKQQAQLDAGLAESSDRLGLMEVQLKDLQRLDIMETNIAMSMGYHVTTNNTLQALQQQQTKILQMLGELAAETKRNQQSLMPTDSEMSSIPADSDLPTPVTPTPMSMPLHGAMSSLTMAARSGNRLTPVDPSTRPNKRKSSHTATDDVSITSEPVPEHLLALTPAEMADLYTSDHHIDNNPMDDMDFEEGDDASSIHTATDLDDQYTITSDPDGGDPG